MKYVISVDTINELMDEAVTQGMIAMQLSMGDGLPGRHDKVIKKTKASLHSLLISKLPEKKPLVLEKEYSTPRELLPQEQEIKLNTNHQVIGFNQAVDNMNRVIDEMFEAKS